MGGTVCISRDKSQVAMALDNIYSTEVSTLLAAVTEAQRLNDGVPPTGPMISAVLVEANVYEDV